MSAEPLPAFVFQTVRRIESAPGLARRLGELVSGLDAPGRSALIVTDAFLASSGLIAPARASLEAAGWQVAVFDAVTPDPSEAVVEAARQAALAHGAGLIIGFGGGSSTDVAKLVACLARPEAPALAELYGIDTRGVARCRWCRCRPPPAPAPKSPASPSSPPARTPRPAWSTARCWRIWCCWTPSSPSGCRRRSPPRPASTRWCTRSRPSPAGCAPIRSPTCWPSTRCAGSTAT